MATLPHRWNMDGLHIMPTGRTGRGSSYPLDPATLASLASRSFVSVVKLSNPPDVSDRSWNETRLAPLEPNQAYRTSGLGAVPESQSSNGQQELRQVDLTPMAQESAGSAGTTYVPLSQGLAVDRRSCPSRCFFATALFRRRRLILDN